MERKLKAALAEKDYRNIRRADGWRLFAEENTLTDALIAAERALNDHNEPTVRIDSNHHGFYVWTL